MNPQDQAELSDSELKSIEMRCRAASPGPWFSYVVGRDMEAGLNCIELGSAHALEIVGASVEDQDFIACARTDLPRVIDEIRRLRAQITWRAKDGNDAGSIGE